MVGVIAVASAITLAGVLFALRRSHDVRERGFGDSLRDHLRRRIAHLEAEATGERRLAFIMVVATLAGGKALTILAGRIRHVPVPWNDMIWPSPVSIILLCFIGLLLFWWIPRQRRDNLQRKRQLEALLKELEGQ